MSNNSDCEVFTTPFKMLRFLFGIYLIPQTFGFLRLTDDELSFSSAAHLRPLAAGSKTAVKTETSQGLDDAVMKADAFIKSLETFDALKNLKQSAQALAVSTKALVEAAGTMTDHVYSAPLYTFVRLEHESFPDVQYHVTVADTKDEAKDWSDLLVDRMDGVFFAFKA
ncbi:unnamed protein product [Bemisia tabaci]|uniref:Uncharacterized protein n=1 Tax=Bemisia tabaci TaxID=7038 RepID=A0A9P0AFV9_BEMTA|nr:unnamed protein product [Bemisia tabaci]